MTLVYEQKSPKDLVALRGDEARRRLPMAATVGAMVIAIPTAMFPAAVIQVMAAIVAGVIMPVVARGDIHHRPAHGRTGPIHDCGRTRQRIRRPDGSGHHDGRGEADWSREREVQRPTRLRRGGAPEDGNHCDQTEERFCFHKRFDGPFTGFFSRMEKREVSRDETVRAKGRENE